ncbi:ankyrin repeat protein [Penicillium robsamsonii]|uniref:ankyrin repeat protein n=1 Tax=Penicillium robsamsonii TaxID=1792511 RepID=UPI002546FD5E|nr:ankyrin repeat protein [Penicillium robsamsonii]KAJ5827331.1 ankyrin repeat protein [Penicillium robsamsonii]
MERSGRLFSLDDGSSSISALPPGLPNSYVNSSGDDVSLSLQEAAREDPDFADVVLAADHYGIPSRAVDHVGVAAQHEPRQVFTVGAGLTSEVVQHTLVDAHLDMNPPPVTSSSTVVALKMFRPATHLPALRDAKAAVRRRVYDAVLKEMKALCHPLLATHPHIVTLLFVGWSLNHEYPLLATELGDHGSLDYVLRSWGPGPSVLQKRHITIDIALGLQAIHQAGFTHGDLKPDNIIVYSDEDPARDVVAKLTDFGGSNQISGPFGGGAPTHFTPIWCAPEVLEREPDIQWNKADVYSYGLVVASLWAGPQGSRGKSNVEEDEPRSPRSSTSVLPGDTKDDLKYLKSLPEDHPDSLMSFLAKRLSKDSRPTGLDPGELFAILTPTLRTDPQRRPNTENLMLILLAFARATGRTIAPLPQQNQFQAYEPKPVRAGVFERDPRLFINATDYPDIIIKHAHRALDEINERMKYVPQQEDIPDNVPADLSTDAFLSNLLTANENNLSRLYKALETEPKDQFWCGIIDFIKKGYLLHTIGYSSLLYLGGSPVPDFRERGLGYMRASSLYGNGNGILSTTFASVGTVHEAGVPVRMNLALLALSQSSLGIQRLHSRWPEGYAMVRRVFREREQNCLQEARAVYPGLYNSPRLVKIYIAGRAISKPISLGHALDIGATDVVRETLSGAGTASQHDQQKIISSLFHRLGTVPDEEAAGLARMVYGKGARLDYLLPTPPADIPTMGSPGKPSTPLSAALMRGQPRLALEIFCLHVEFDEPITQFLSALYLAFTNLYREVGEALLRIWQDNPALCVDVDGATETGYVPVNLSQVLATTAFQLVRCDTMMLHGGQHEVAYVETVKFLLGEGADPSSGAPAATALGRCILADDITALKLYIEHIETLARKAHLDANVAVSASLSDPHNITTVQRAAVDEHRGDDEQLSFEFKDTFTALALSIRHGSLQCLQFLLAKSSHLVNVEVDFLGQTLLHRVCHGVERLVIEGDSSEVPGLVGLVARARFPSGLSAEFVDLLLNAGADIMATDHQGYTSLFWALLRGNIAAADIIASRCSQAQLDHMLSRNPLTGGSMFQDLVGMDVRKLNSISGQRQSRLVQSLQWLEKRDAVYFYGTDNQPVWALILSSRLRTLRKDQLLDVALMQYLINLPMFADKLHTGRHSGYTVLHAAVAHGNVEIVRLLLDKGCDPNFIMEAAATQGVQTSYSFSPAGVTALDLIIPILVSGSSVYGVDKTSKAEFRKWQDKILDIANLLVERGARGEVFERYQTMARYGNKAFDRVNESKEAQEFPEQLRNLQRPAEIPRQHAVPGAWPKPLLPNDDLPTEADATSTLMDPPGKAYLDLGILLGAFRELDERRQGRQHLGKQLLLAEAFYIKGAPGQDDGIDDESTSRRTMSSSESPREHAVPKDGDEDELQDTTTRLHLAVEDGDLSAFTDAVDSIDDVDAEDEQGNSPLDRAITANPSHIRTRMISLLLQAGANPNRTTSQKTTPPLHIGILLRDDPDIVQKLLEAGAEVNVVNDQIQNALILAVALRRENTVSVLLSAGADATQRTVGGLSVVHITVMTKQPKVLSLMLSYMSREQAEPRLKRMVDAVAEEADGDKTGDCNSNDPASTHRESPDQDPWLGRAPLHFAAHAGDTTMMRLLVNEGGADPNVRDAQAMTPLHHAVVEATVEAAEMLIDEAGADVNARNIEQVTPLVWWFIKYILSQKNADRRMHDLLLSRGADSGVVAEFQFLVRADDKPELVYRHVGKGKRHEDRRDEVQSLRKASGAPWVELEWDPLIVLKNVTTAEE